MIRTLIQEQREGSEGNLSGDSETSISKAVDGEGVTSTLVSFKAKRLAEDAKADIFSP